MRVAVFSTDLGRGGATIAMIRLANGLIDRGHDVRIFCLSGESSVGSVFHIENSEQNLSGAGIVNFVATELQTNLINLNRTHLSNTLFSTNLIGYDLSEVADLSEFDVFNVHWVAHFLTAETIVRLTKFGKPIVLTLHDMFPFTGGCHYSAGCRGFVSDCNGCPQLETDPLGLPRFQLARRREYAQHRSIAAIGPSRWISDLAIESHVFAPDRVHTISNSLSIARFRRVSRLAARQRFGLSDDRFAILLGAQNNSEHRKGVYNIIDAMAALKADAAGAALIASGKILLLSFGISAPILNDIGIEVRHLGVIEEDEDLVAAYSAADIFLLPSLEDNQPNVMLEAMACETPVISFAVGGMVDVIVDGVNGRLLRAFDCEAMAAAIRDLALDPTMVAAMGREARRTIELGFTTDLQARRYEELFESMQVELAAQPHAQSEIQGGVSAGANMMQVRREIDSSFLNSVPGLAIQQLLVDQQRRRIVELEADQVERGRRIAELEGRVAIAESERTGLLHRHQAQLETIERAADAIHRRLSQSTSWRFAAPIRALFGFKPFAPAAYDEAGDRILWKMDDNCAVTTSIWWDLAAPVRLLGRPLSLLRRLLLRGTSR